MRNCFRAPVGVLVPALLLPMLSAAPAFAHPGELHTHGFADGVLHPLFGIDHMAAMVTVGLYAALIGGRAVLGVPAVFVSVMLVGGILGMAGFPLPLVEPMIYTSILVFVVLAALPATRSTSTAAAVAGWFALFHGYAHGAEMPADASAIGYAAGFALATALLHGAGIGIGIGARRLFARRAVMPRG